MSLSKKQKLKALSKDSAFLLQLAYIEKRSIQLQRITGKTKFILRSRDKTLGSARIKVCCGCDSLHDFSLVVKTYVHCTIHIPIFTVLKYNRDCEVTQYTIQKYHYSTNSHLFTISYALDQAIIDAHGAKARFLDSVNNPPEVISHRFEKIELKGG